jgi:AraC-like DNA-binding protein
MQDQPSWSRIRPELVSCEPEDGAAPEPMAPISTLGAVAGQLGRAGIDSSAFFEEYGLNPVELLAGHYRIPCSRMAAIWEGAARRTSDATFGVHAAFGSGYSLTLPGCLVALSMTWGDGLHRFCRYSPLLGGHLACALTQDNGCVNLSLIPQVPVPELSRQEGEFVMATVALRGNKAMPAARPTEVAFPFPAPGDPTLHGQVFGPRVSWNADCLRLTFPTATMKARLAGGDPVVLGVMEAVARIRVEYLGHGQHPLMKIGSAVEAGLLAGDASLFQIARQAGLSPRALQRQLEQAGSSFRGVVDDGRRRLALRWVADSEMPFKEIAARLGFSDTATFSRAFRRWTEKTPESVRRSKRRPK